MSRTKHKNDIKIIKENVKESSVSTVDLLSLSRLRKVMKMSTIDRLSGPCDNLSLLILSVIIKQRQKSPLRRLQSYKL